MAALHTVERGQWVFRWNLRSPSVAVFAESGPRDVPYDMYAVPADVNRSKATPKTLGDLADRWLATYSPRSVGQDPPTVREPLIAYVATVYVHAADAASAAAIAQHANEVLADHFGGDETAAVDIDMDSLALPIFREG
jgi:hypothetical protein